MRKAYSLGPSGVASSPGGSSVGVAITRARSGMVSGSASSWSSRRSVGPQLGEADDMRTHWYSGAVSDGEPHLAGPPVEVQRPEVRLAVDGTQPVRSGLVCRREVLGEARGC